MAGEKNGTFTNGRGAWVVIGPLVAVGFMTLMGLLYNSQAATADKHDVRITTAERDIRDTRERLAGIEATTRETREDVREIRRILQESPLGRGSRNDY